jgi:hypothetical protein
MHFFEGSKTESFITYLQERLSGARAEKAHPLYIIQDWPKYSFTVTNALSQLSHISFAFVMSFVLVIQNP